jgi:hypothetical protein
MDKDTDNFVDGAEDKTTSPHYQCPCQRPLCERETNEEQFVIVWEEHKHHDKDKVGIIAEVLHPQKTYISSRKIPAQNLCIMNMQTSS